MHALRVLSLLSIAATSSVVAQLDLDPGNLVNAVIIPGSTALIDLGVLAGILSPADARIAVPVYTGRN